MSESIIEHENHERDRDNIIMSYKTKKRKRSKGLEHLEHEIKYVDSSPRYPLQHTD